MLPSIVFYMQWFHMSFFNKIAYQRNELLAAVFLSNKFSDFGAKLLVRQVFLFQTFLEAFNLICHLNSVRIFPGFPFVTRASVGMPES